jgi:hypothetical protein
METNPLDFTHDGEIAGIPGELELYLGIMGACLPLISPPLLAIRQKVSAGYSSIREKRRPGYSGSGSDAESLPKDETVGKPLSWEDLALKSWPDSAKDCTVEAVPTQRRSSGEMNEHSIQCNSEWVVRSETRSQV